MNNELLPGRILIVDDDELSLDFLSLVLTAEGHTVIKARDGIEAFDKFDKVEPDLVLLDLAMPRLNGYAACVQIRRNPKAQYAAILVVTGYGDLEDRLEAYQVGADDLLLKPVSRLELISRVRALLRMRNYKIMAARYEGAIAAALEETATIVQAIEVTRAGLVRLPGISAMSDLDNALAACRRLEQQLACLSHPAAPEPTAPR